MVELAKPTLQDTIIDSAMGTAGFLSESAKYIQENYKAELTKKISQQAKSSIGGALGEQTSGALKNILSGDKSSNPLGNVLKGF